MHKFDCLLNDVKEMNLSIMWIKTDINQESLLFYTYYAVSIDTGIFIMIFIHYFTSLVAMESLETRSMFSSK